MSDTNKHEQFLLKEYEQATQLTYHIDTLRNSLTGFFLTFAGIASAGLAILIKGEASRDTRYFSEGILAVLLALVALLGLIVMMILARLRSAQLEHFRIINNIRIYFIGNDLSLWNIVELSSETIPAPNLRSGTYFWTLLISISSCTLLVIAASLSMTQAGITLSGPWRWIVLAAILLSSVLLYNLLYFFLAKAAPRRTYSVVPGTVGTGVPNHTLNEGNKLTI